MSEQNKAVSRGVFEAWERGDLDALDDLVSPDATDHDAYNPFREEGLGFADFAHAALDRHSAAWAQDPGKLPDYGFVRMKLNRNGGFTGTLCTLSTPLKRTCMRSLRLYR